MVSFQHYSLSILNVSSVAGSASTMSGSFSMCSPSRVSGSIFSSSRGNWVSASKLTSPTPARELVSSLERLGGDSPVTEIRDIRERSGYWHLRERHSRFSKYGTNTWISYLIKWTFWHRFKLQCFPLITETVAARHSLIITLKITSFLQQRISHSVPCHLLDSLAPSLTQSHFKRRWAALIAQTRTVCQCLQLHWE